MTVTTRLAEQATSRLRRITGVAIVLAGAVATAIVDRWYLDRLEPVWLVACWLVFSVVLAGLAWTEPLRSVPVIVLAAAIVQLPGLCTAPRLSTDAYRYVWDGRVQLSGTSPYRMAPLDDRLAGLRDPVLFPGLGPHDRTGVDRLPLPHEPGVTTGDRRSRINRPRVPTIYPPVAQLWFAGVAAVTPWSAGTFGIQLGAALCAVATTMMLAIALRRRGRRPWPALAFGLCPAVAIEAGNSGHVELLMTLLLVAAGITIRRRLLSGILLGLAIATKIVPLLVLPALRTGLRGRLATVGTVLASYLPHLVVTGWLVFGYLPGYLNEEGFESGRGRYAVLALVLPQPVRAPAALVLGVALAVVAWLLAEPDGVPATATWLLGGAMLLGTPTYPWYTLPLLGLAVLAERLEWLAVVAAAYGAYAAYDDPARISAWYATAAVIVLTAAVIRQRTSATSRPARRARPEQPIRPARRALNRGRADW